MYCSWVESCWLELLYVNRWPCVDVDESVIQRWRLTFAGRCLRRDGWPTRRRRCRWRRGRRRRSTRRHAGTARSTAVCRSATARRVVHDARTCQVAAEPRLVAAGQPWCLLGLPSLQQSTAGIPLYFTKAGVYNSAVSLTFRGQRHMLPHQNALAVVTVCIGLMVCCSSAVLIWPLNSN